MADRVGQRLDNYRLSRLLGAGGFGEVYLAEHVYRKTQVAVKVLPPLAEDDLPGFLNEARTMRLRHPHIVQILDFGVDNHIPFIVMEYFSNGTLRQRYPKGSQLPPDLIVLYVKQVADALQYAHNEKLIHRDVKPENMLLRSDKEVLLSDFGIVAMAHSSRSQSIQEMAGTMSYMAPEQIQGKPAFASDQYALGIVVYEWLCGDRPFKGSTMEIATQHMLAPIPSLREKVSTIPSAVEQVVLTALEKEPNSRFATVKAFANALEQASTSEPFFFPPPAVVSPPTLTPSRSEPSNPPQLIPALLDSTMPASTLLPSSAPHSTSPSFLSTSGNFPLPTSLTRPKSGISRRALLLGLSGSGIAVAGGGITWLVLSQQSRTSIGSSTSFSPSTSASNTVGVKKIANAGLKTPGFLQWGADYVDDAPYVYKDPKNPANLIGFEVDIMQAVANLMGVTQRQIETCYGQLDQALAANNFDFVFNGWEITDERKKTQLFSDPYYRYAQQIVVRTSDSRFTQYDTNSNLSLSVLYGMTVGTGDGYKAATILQGFPQITTKLYIGNLPFDDVKEKKLDATFLDTPLAAYYVLGAGPGGVPDTALRPIGKPIYPDVYIAGFNKSNPNAQTLLNELNLALARLKKDGTLKKIYITWKMWNDQQAQIGIV